MTTTTTSNAGKVQWRTGPLAEPLTRYAACWGCTPDEVSLRLVALCTNELDPALHPQISEMAVIFATDRQRHAFARACGYVGPIMADHELEHGPLALSEQRSLLRGLITGAKRSFSKNGAKQNAT